MNAYPISELMVELGEERVLEILSSFSVERNPDVQRFMRENAIPYEKSGNARSFLCMSDDGDPIGFFSLALNILHVPETVTERRKEKLTGFGRRTSKDVPCYLIGQLARLDGVSKEILSGDDMFAKIFEYLNISRKFFGGRVLAIDCVDDLVSYYEDKGFFRVDKVDDLNHMAMVLRK